MPKPEKRPTPPKRKFPWIAVVACAVMLVLGIVVGTGLGGEKPAAPREKAKVSVFWYDENDVFLSSVRDALNRKLEAAGVAYDNQFAANDQTTQLSQIRNAVSAGSNLLVVNVVDSGDPAAAQTILDAAGDIPVIFFNRDIGYDGSDVTVLSENASACFIGTDISAAGRVQGRMIGDYVLANYDAIDLNGDGVISYAMFKGQEGNLHADYRTRFSVETADGILTAAGKPALVYFDAGSSDKYQVDPEGAWSARAACDYMVNNLVSYNEANGNMIELVICNNDGMAEGAIAALQDAGYNTYASHTVPVFGIDATAAARYLIAEGTMTGSVIQDVEGLAAAITQTVEGISGGKAPADALASLTDERFSVAGDCASKLYVAYAPYTGA